MSQRYQGLCSPGGVRFNREFILPKICLLQHVPGGGKHMETRQSSGFWGSWTPCKETFQALRPVAFPALGDAVCQLFLSIVLNSCLFSLFTLSVDDEGSEMLTHVLCLLELRSCLHSQPQELCCFSGVSARFCPSARLCPGKPNSALSSYTRLFSSTASWAVQPLDSAPVFQCFGLVMIVLNTNLILWPRK